MSSDEAAAKDGDAGQAASEVGAPVEAKPRERRDADGLPMDRAPTLDDVRGESGSGRTIAWGCTALVLVVLAGFWLVRAFLLG